MPARVAIVAPGWFATARSSRPRTPAEPADSSRPVPVSRRVSSGSLPGMVKAAFCGASRRVPFIRLSGATEKSRSPWTAPLATVPVGSRPRKSSRRSDPVRSGAPTRPSAASSSSRWPARLSTLRRNGWSSRRSGIRTARFAETGWGLSGSPAWRYSGSLKAPVTSPVAPPSRLLTRRPRSPRIPSGPARTTTMPLSRLSRRCPE